MGTTTTNKRPLDVQINCNSKQHKQTLSFGSERQKNCIELLARCNKSVWQLNNLLRTTCSADVIYKLRKRGWDIKTINQPGCEYEEYQLDTPLELTQKALKAYKA